jgi:hypothetical protein
MEADGVDPRELAGNAEADVPEAGPASRSIGTAVHARSPLLGHRSLTTSTELAGSATRKLSQYHSITSPNCAAFATALVRLSAPNLASIAAT